MKLYKYSGTIEELAVERGRISYIKLFDVTDFDKAPTRLISIHALREEGDMVISGFFEMRPSFLSTPSARRATAKTEKNISAFVSL